MSERGDYSISSQQFPINLLSARHADTFVSGGPNGEKGRQIERGEGGERRGRREEWEREKSGRDCVSTTR